MPKFLRKLLGLLLLMTTIGLSTCQSLGNAIALNSNTAAAHSNVDRGES